MAEPENKEESQAEELTEEQQAEADAKVEAEAKAEAEGKAEGEAEGEDKEAQTVAPERIKELTDRIKQLEEQAEVSAQQIALAKANPVQSQVQQQQQFDVFKEVGLDPEDPEDIPNQQQLKQILGHYGTVFDKRIADIDFRSAHPDFAELVGTADEIASAQYAAPLAAAIKKNPALLVDIGNSPNPRLAAYNIAKLQKDKAPGKQISKDEAEAAIKEAAEKAKKVKSSANVKGGGALSEEGRYANMSDADFLKLAASHGAIV